MTVALAAAAMTALMVGTALAGGAADKATGDVSWNAGGAYRTAQFDAHEARDGRPAKGSMVYTAVNSTTNVAESFSVDSLTHVNVTPESTGGGTACFAGQVSSATDGYQSRIGQYVVVYVRDGDPAGAGDDEYGANYASSTTNADATCADFAANHSFDVVDGNLQVHAGKSYE